MRHIKRLGHAAHTSFLIFLGLAATLSFEVRLAHPQTDEAKALYKQSPSSLNRVDIPKR